MHTISSDTPDWLEQSLTVLRRGQVLAFPTDTSYGLGCDVDQSTALDALYLIKERGKDKAIHVLVQSAEQAQRLVFWSAAAEKLAKTCWPGPLTLVLPLLPNAPAWATMLSAGTGYLGVRVPQQRLAQQLLSGWGKPLPAPSANPSAHLSGGVDSYSAKAVYTQFANQTYQPAAILDAGEVPEVSSSTLIRIESSGQWAILRQGPISETNIKTILA
jgi:L-threonylcarbamoyladenylate synthase